MALLTEEQIRIEALRLDANRRDFFSSLSLEPVHVPYGTLALGWQDWYQHAEELP